MMLLDDSVHNKQYLRSTEMIKLQYSGAVGVYYYEKRIKDKNHDI